LKKKYPEYKKDSPTSKIGGKNKDIFSKVVHDVQMQSLQDVFSFEELREFDEMCKQAEEFSRRKNNENIIEWWGEF
jgi:DNA ligase (NAD+)